MIPDNLYEPFNSPSPQLRVWADSAIEWTWLRGGETLTPAAIVATFPGNHPGWWPILRLSASAEHSTTRILRRLTRAAEAATGLRVVPESLWTKDLRFGETLAGPWFETNTCLERVLKADPGAKAACDSFGPSYFWDLLLKERESQSVLSEAGFRVDALTRPAQAFTWADWLQFVEQSRRLLAPGIPQRRRRTGEAADSREMDNDEVRALCRTGQPDLRAWLLAARAWARRMRASVLGPEAFACTGLRHSASGINLQRFLRSDRRCLRPVHESLQHAGQRLLERRAQDESGRRIGVSPPVAAVWRALRADGGATAVAGPPDIVLWNLFIQNSPDVFLKVFQEAGVSPAGLATEVARLAAPVDDAMLLRETNLLAADMRDFFFGGGEHADRAR